jgi:hypothetical protein
MENYAAARGPLKRFLLRAANQGTDPCGFKDALKSVLFGLLEICPDVFSA